MIKYEWLKLKRNPVLYLILLGLFLLNMVMLFYQGQAYREDIRCFPKEQSVIYQELEQIPKEESLTWLEQEIEKSKEVMVNRKNALQRVEEHVKSTRDYDEYLENIVKRAKQVSTSALFSNNSFYTKSTAAKTVKAYDKLNGLDVEAIDSQGFLLITESKITSFCLLLFTLLFVYYVIGIEREEGTAAFLRTMKWGGAKTAWSKCVAVFLAVFLVSILFYGADILIAWWHYGKISTNAWVQSLQGYITCSFKVTVGQMLFMEIMSKIFALLLFAVVLMTIFLFARNIRQAGAVILGLSFAEWQLYKRVALESSFGILRACNVFTLLNIEKIYKQLTYVNIFGKPYSTGLVLFLTSAFLLFAFCAILILKYDRVSRQEYYSSTKKSGWGIKVTSGWKSSLSFWEGKKLFFVQKAGVVWIAYLLLLTFFLSHHSIWFTEEEMYYKYYARQMTGTITEEKKEYLLQEEAKLEEKEEVSEEHWNAFTHVVEQTERIGEDGYFLDEVAYQSLLDCNVWYAEVGILYVFLALSFFGAFIYEKNTGMKQLLHSIYRGKKKVRDKKWTWLFVTTILLCILTDGMVIGYLMNKQGIHDFTVSLRYISGYETLAVFSVWALLVIRCILHMLCCFLFLWCIEKLSEKLEHTVMVFIAAVGCGVLLFGMIFLIQKMVFSF